jgi:hypothetical protein
MRNLLYSLLLTLLFLSCEKDESSALNDKVYYSLWETDSVAVKTYTDSVNSNTNLFKKAAGYFSWEFTGVSHNDVGNCTNDQNMNKEILKFNFIDSSNDTTNYAQDCFFAYKKYHDVIYKSEVATLDNNNFDWGTVDSGDRYEIIQENTAYAIVKSTEFDYPQLGNKTETYYYFSKTN